MTTNGNQTDNSVQTKRNSRAWVLIMKARKLFLSSETPELGLLARKSKQTLNMLIGHPQMFFSCHFTHALTRKTRPEVHYFLIPYHLVILSPDSLFNTTKTGEQVIRIELCNIICFHDVLKLISKTFPFNYDLSQVTLKPLKVFPLPRLTWLTVLTLRVFPLACLSKKRSCT